MRKISTKKERVPGLKPGTLIRQAFAKSNFGFGREKINILHLGKIFIILKQGLHPAAYVIMD